MSSGTELEEDRHTYLIHPNIQVEGKATCSCIEIVETSVHKKNLQK